MLVTRLRLRDHHRGRAEDDRRHRIPDERLRPSGNDANRARSAHRRRRPGRRALALALAGSGLHVTLLEARPDVHPAGRSHSRALARQPAHPRATRHLGRPGDRDTDRYASTFRSAAALAAACWPPRKRRTGARLRARYASLQELLGKALAKAAQVELISGAQAETLAQGTDTVSLQYRREGQSPFDIRTPAGDRGRRRQPGAAGRCHHQVPRLRTRGSRRRAQDFASARLRATSASRAEGPVALLPFEDRYALVWTAAPEAAEPPARPAGTGVPARRCRGISATAPAASSRSARAGAIPLGAAHRALTRYCRARCCSATRRRRCIPSRARDSISDCAMRGSSRRSFAAWATETPGAQASLARYRHPQPRSRERHRDSRTRWSGYSPTTLGRCAPLRGGGLAMLDLLPAAKRAFVQRMIFGARVVEKSIAGAVDSRPTCHVRLR